MKILHVVSYFPPHLGGMEVCTKEIAERLAKRGHQVEVFTSGIGCQNGRLKSTKNLKIHYLKSFEVAHTPIIPSLFFKLLKMPRDSVIHLHISQAFIPEVVYLVSKIRKIPYIAHFHTDVGSSGKLGFLLPWYKKYFLEKVLKSARRVVVLTQEYKGILNRKYSLSKNVAVVPNGVNEKFFFSKKSFSFERANLLFVGRLTIEKNVSRLVKAVSQLKSKVIFHIVGDGEMRPEIEKLISDRRLRNVILYGRKTREDLIGFYRLADIFLLASDYEGLPLVLLEAMASGVPIIASDARGVRDLVIGVGLLVSPPKAENFAKVIDDLIKDGKLRERLSREGRGKARQYGWDKVVEKYEEVYRGVLNEAY